MLCKTEEGDWVPDTMKTTLEILKYVWNDVFDKHDKITAWKGKSATDYLLWLKINIRLDYKC